MFPAASHLQARVFMKEVCICYILEPSPAHQGFTPDCGLLIVLVTPFPELPYWLSWVLTTRLSFSPAVLHASVACFGSELLGLQDDIMGRSQKWQMSEFAAGPMA
jgi:hypothetical protein